MSKKYEFTNNAGLKELKVRLEGMFNAKDAEEYIRDYRDVVSRIKPNETVFNLDCTKMIVTPADVVPQLEGCFKMYKEDKFKKVVFKIPTKGGFILKSQFSRLARKVGLENIEIIQ